MSTPLTEDETTELRKILKSDVFQKACMIVQAKHQPKAGIDTKIAAIPGISGLEMLGLQQMRDAGAVGFPGELAELAWPPAPLPKTDPRSAQAQLDWLAQDAS